MLERNDEFEVVLRLFNLQTTELNLREIPGVQEFVLEGVDHPLSEGFLVHPRM